MREIDPLRVCDALSNIGQALRRLNDLRRLSPEEFLADYRNTESAKYLLIVAVEAAVDLCNHIMARREGRAPHGYADCFAALSELGAISPELAEHLQRMARFRNLIVHLYWKVDDLRVYEIMQNDLGDLEDFRQQVSAWLDI